MAEKLSFYDYIRHELDDIQSSGLFKKERVITSAQRARISVQTPSGSKEVLNFCANNYLGLSAHPDVIKAAQDALATHGFGLSSVRFICGTQDLHKTLESRLSQFLGTQDTILYPAAFDANGGLFEPLLGEMDAIVSDQLNHASIIDGIRLCKAKRYRYLHNDMADARRCCEEARRDGARFILVFTDGVFSMDGTIAQLDKLRIICDEYNALLGIDECHATGFLGKTGRGTHEFKGVFGKIDIITGTLGKAMGGASGGFTSGRSEVIQLLRQRSRPYLFSNTLAPNIVGATIKVLDMIENSTELRDRLMNNTRFFREAIQAEGFEIKTGEHPIIPIMIYDAVKTQALATRLLDLDIYAIGFFFPVVPKNQARIRVQMSAAHSQTDLEKAVSAFGHAGRELGII